MKPKRYDVRDYGADSTGVATNSHVGINAAIAERYAAGDTRTTSRGVVIEVPQGVYKTSAPIKLKPGTHLRGDGRGVTIIWQTSNIEDCIQCDPEVAYSNQQIIIEGITIRGTTTATQGTLLRLEDLAGGYSTYATVREVELYYGFDGLLVNDGITCRIDDVRAFHCLNRGFVTTGTLNASTFINCYANTCGTDGYHIDGISNYNAFLNCGSDSNGGNGYRIDAGGRQWSFISCGAEGSTGDGFYVLGGVGFTFVDCTVAAAGSDAFHFNGTDGVTLLNPYTYGAVTGYGINFDSSSTPCYGALIVGGSIATGTAGIVNDYSTVTIIGNATQTGMAIGGGLNGSVILGLASTTQGLLFPRMTTAQRDNIASPMAGLVIYSTTNSRLEFYNGAVWGAV